MCCTPHLFFLIQTGEAEAGLVAPDFAAAHPDRPTIPMVVACSLVLISHPRLRLLEDAKKAADIPRRAEDLGM